MERMADSERPSNNFDLLTEQVTEDELAKKLIAAWKESPTKEEALEKLRTVAQEKMEKIRSDLSND